jgi:hypothetical protein
MAIQELQVKLGTDLHFRDCKKCNVFEMLEENVVATSVTSNNR